MVNSAEDILDTISPLSTVHRSVSAKTQGIIPISLSSLRPACAMSFLLFMLFSSLKRALAMMMTMMMMMMMMKMNDEDVDDGNVPGYGYYITLLCCFPQVSPWIQEL